MSFIDKKNLNPEQPLNTFCVDRLKDIVNDYDIFKNELNRSSFIESDLNYSNKLAMKIANLSSSISNFDKSCVDDHKYSSYSYGVNKDVFNPKGNKLYDSKNEKEFVLDCYDDIQQIHDILVTEEKNKKRMFIIDSFFDDLKDKLNNPKVINNLTYIDYGVNSLNHPFNLIQFMNEKYSKEYLMHDCAGFINSNNAHNRFTNTIRNNLRLPRPRMK